MFRRWNDTRFSLLTVWTYRTGGRICQSQGPTFLGGVVLLRPSPPSQTFRGKIRRRGDDLDTRRARGPLVRRLPTSVGHP